MVMSIDQLIRELALATERGGENRKEKEEEKREEGRGRQIRTEGRRRQAQTQLHPQPLPVLLKPCLSTCDPRDRWTRKPVFPPAEAGAMPDPNASFQFPLIHVINRVISLSRLGL